MFNIKLKLFTPLAWKLKRLLSCDLIRSVFYLNKKLGLVGYQVDKSKLGLIRISTCRSAGDRQFIDWIRFEFLDYLFSRHISCR